jgi:hypothetical protein
MVRGAASIFMGGIIRSALARAGVIVVAVLAATQTFAAGRADQPLVRITADQAEIPLVPAVWIYDATRTLDRAGAAARLASPEASIAMATFSYGYRPEAMWLSVLIEVEPAAAGLRYLVLGLSNFDRLDIYPSWLPGADGGNGPAAQIGDRVPTRSPVLSRYHVWPVELPAGRHEILFRAESTSTMTVPLSIWQPLAYHTQEQEHVAHQFVYAGVVALLTVIGLLLYVQLRLIEFLLYAINVAVHGAQWLAIGGVGRAYIWPWAPGWADIASVVLIDLTIVSLITFALAFVARRHIPRPLYLLLQGDIAISLALAIACPFASNDQFRLLGQVTGGVMVPVSAVLSIAMMVFAFRTSASARFLLFAWSGLILGATISISRTFEIGRAHV